MSTFLAGMPYAFPPNILSDDVYIVGVEAQAG